MKYLIKPLTKKMLTQLQIGRSIEQSKTGRNVCIPDDYKGSLAGLYRRGFVTTKMTLFDGKEMLAVYITEPGINFLKRYEEDAINMKKSTIFCNEKTYTITTKSKTIKLLEWANY